MDLPKEVKDRLFDLTDPKNYDKVKGIKTIFINSNKEIKDKEGNIINIDKQTLFNNCLREENGIFKRKSDEESDDTVFFKKIIQTGLESEPEQYVGTYTKKKNFSR